MGAYGEGVYGQGVYGGAGSVTLPAPPKTIFKIGSLHIGPIRVGIKMMTILHILRNTQW
jgi:hypothetical protein